MIGVPDTLARAVLAAVLLAAGATAWRLFVHTSLARAARLGPEGLEPGRIGLLYFSSPACALCRAAQKPAIERLASELNGGLQIVEIDVTQDPRTAERYGVVSLPTTIVFDPRGRPSHVNHGLVSIEALRRQTAVPEPANAAAG